MDIFKFRRWFLVLMPLCGVDVGGFACFKLSTEFWTGARRNRWWQSDDKYDAVKNTRAWGTSTRREREKRNATLYVP